MGPFSAAIMREMEKFRSERLVARPWQIEDLPLAMELWGDPAVTALIDSRSKLTNAQVGEKLRAEIERERSGGVQYWALFDHRDGEFVGCGAKFWKLNCSGLFGS
jgi:RimJ/RimL family protein N-acetyltransferase